MLDSRFQPPVARGGFNWAGAPTTGLKPASTRSQGENSLRSLALALNFLVRRARIACPRQPWSYPRRGTAGVPQRMSSRHTHFRNSLTKWRILPNLAILFRWETGGGSILDLGGGPRHPSPIVVCRGGGADPPRRLRCVLRAVFHSVGRPQYKMKLVSSQILELRLLKSAVSFRAALDYPNGRF